MEVVMEGWMINGLEDECFQHVTTETSPQHITEQPWVVVCELRMNQVSKSGRKDVVTTSLQPHTCHYDVIATSLAWWGGGAYFNLQRTSNMSYICFARLLI